MSSPRLSGEKPADCLDVEDCEHQQQQVKTDVSLTGFRKRESPLPPTDSTMLLSESVIEAALSSAASNKQYKSSQYANTPLSGLLISFAMAKSQRVQMPFVGFDHEHEKNTDGQLGPNSSERYSPMPGTALTHQLRGTV
ncbi:uncharacterized protein V6R79_021979 [Siganus canaliculatus]